ncbi:MAG TPA: type II toxin-antitoxin system RelE/ParE family toxin [Longimicrobium sp.]|nr:type II toxin-antitoxin system RelE/ParE family toxin [Longimicrobium sp.]
MNLRFTDDAKAEIQEARGFYAGTPARAGFNAELRRAAALLRERPLAGKPAGRVAREFVLPGAYPYSLIYHIDHDTVVVSAVAHHRRDPTYWRGQYGPEP